MTKRPKKGDWVKVWDSLHEVELTGRVVDLLNKQFTFVTEQGATRFCFYDGTWEVVM
jgi:hypothetical protein